MKKLLFVLAFLGVTAVIFGFFYGAIRLDLWLNPWLLGIDFKWTMLFTTDHGMTLLFIQNSSRALLFNGVISFLFTGVLAISV